MASAQTYRNESAAGFQNIYEYVKEYQSQLQEISEELGHSEQKASALKIRKNWKDYREEETVRNRFYQGEYVYFNPDEKSRTDKNVDYYAVNYVIRKLKECDIKQRHIATICNVSTAIVSGWMTGTEDSDYKNGQEIRNIRIKDTIRNNFEHHPNIHPNKYQWWAIGIEIQLPASLLDPFLMMVGAVFEPFRQEDQIIYSKMRPDLKTRYLPEEHSAANIRELLKNSGLDEKLCKDALLAFHIADRTPKDKTKSTTKSTDD